MNQLLIITIVNATSQYYHMLLLAWNVLTQLVVVMC